MQHLGDRDDLNLFGDQGELVRAMVGTGKPVVVLLINGRPITIDYVEKHVPAIVEAWYPGRESGTAAAEVLFGQYNPGGKLPITFPRTVGDLPELYIHERVSEVTQPVEELRKFQRVSLKPGQTRTVTFTLTPQDFAQWDINMQFKVEPGIYDVMVGGSSDKTISVPLDLVQR